MLSHNHSSLQTFSDPTRIGDVRFSIADLEALNALSWRQVLILAHRNRQPAIGNQRGSLMVFL